MIEAGEHPQEHKSNVSPEPIVAQPAPKRKASLHWLKIVGIVVASAAASVGATWVLLTVGIIKPDVSKTIADNREKIVLQEGETVADVFKKVSPSTVSIITEQMTAVDS